jgi:dephospho-CoA kinase
VTNRLLIGLTGGIGSGKSEAARILRELGAYVISADDAGKWAMDNALGILDWVKKNFGGEVFDSEGNLLRKKLGEIVFSNSEKKKLLDEKIFPPLYGRIKESIKAVSDEYNVIVVDAAMIFEWGVENDFDLIISVVSTEEAIYNRLVRRDNFDIAQINNRIHSQLPVLYKAGKSDYIIRNDGTKKELRRAVIKFWEETVASK